MAKYRDVELDMIFRCHAARYPLLEPCDAVKLLFQQEFGGGHLITDEAESLARLRAEYAAVVYDETLWPVEHIGGGKARVMLAGLDPAGNFLESLNHVFFRAAQTPTGDRTAFGKKLLCLQEIAAQGIFAFTEEALAAYLSTYRAAGCPIVSHSPSYRAAYHPAYRVVPVADAEIYCAGKKAGQEGTMRDLADAVWREIKAALEGRKRVVVAIDGRCASGKTTLAAELQASHGCGVIHMDQFFLRPEQRSAERDDQPGGNIDYERFGKEVLLPLKAGRSFVYRPYDCRTQRLAEPVEVATSEVTVVEGSYACHPALWDAYDLRLFLTVDAGTQMERIICRNGLDYAEVFRQRWIPMEERYFSTFQIRERCLRCYTT